MTGQRVVLIIAALGLLLGLAVLRYRNLFEDEWFTLSAIQRPLPDLWNWANTRDLHPPGIYVIDKLLLELVKSPRLLAAIHLFIWSAGCLSFVLSARRLLGSTWGQAVFAAVAFMHPLVLMRVSGIRWYPIWWGLALALAGAGLLARRRGDVPTWGETVALGLAAGLLVYLDYMAVMFLVCFGVAWLVRNRPLPVGAIRLMVLAAVAGLVASPQLLELIRGGFQRGPVMAALRLPYGLLIGEALLPWSPVGVLVGLGLVIPSLWLLVRRLPARLREIDPPAARGVAALFVFLMLFAAAGVALGIGNRTYSLVGLVPLVSLFLALGAERVAARPWRGWATALVVLWIATGAYNLIARVGTAKRQFNDRPEEMIGQLHQLSAAGPALVVTDDLVLTYEINDLRARGRTQLVTCSPINDRYHGYPAGLHEDIARFPLVFVIGHPESPNEALALSRQLIADERQVDLGLDPDWKLKNRFANARVAPSRLRAYYGRPLPGDWQDVGRRMELASRIPIEGDVDSPGARSGD